MSRLDRLFILLDTGSSESIRLAAAKQLGQVQKIQPDDLDYLLRRIKDYSFKPVWETRVAAGHAIKNVLEHVAPWPLVKPELEQTTNEDKTQVIKQLLDQHGDAEKILKGLDLDQIVTQSPTLLSNILTLEQSDSSSARASTASGKGRGNRLSSSGLRKPTKEQLQKQRQLINKELGISMVDSLNMGVKSTDIISNDDLQVDYNEDQSSDNLTRDKNLRQIVLNHTTNHPKLLDILNQNSICGHLAGDSKVLHWPITEIAKEYEEKLFDPSWEIRHGAAIALREIVKLQGKYAGRQSNFSKDINDRLNQLWLVDVAIKSLCILSLDRFGDFLFDQVVAPVRENAAQLLGCCVALLSKVSTRCIIDILLKMLASSSWETRHGGILGLKYSLSILDHENVKDIIGCTFDHIVKCLADSSDDVSAEAAASLVPVKDFLLETVPDKTPKLIKFLWEHLADLDELTSSTSNIILLLASLITSCSTRLESNELIKSIPRLWPLLNHPSTTVRLSVLKALTVLAKSQSKPCLLWMPEELITVALRLIFQRSVLENMHEVRLLLEEVWLQLIKVDGDKLSLDECRLKLLVACSQYLNYWLCLAMQAPSVPIDRAYALWLNINSDGSVSDVKPDGDIYIASSTFNADSMELQKFQITNCRILSTKLLGALYSELVVDFEESQHARETLKYLSGMFIHYLSMKSANHRMISGWAIESWASYQVSMTRCDDEKLKSILPEALKKQLNSAIQETNLCYDELATAFTRLQQDARDFANSLVAANITTNIPIATDRRIIYNLNQIQTLCDLDIKEELNRADSKKQKPSHGLSHSFSDSAISSMETKKAILKKSYQSTRASQKGLSVSTLSSLACALISWKSQPDKIQFLIEPLLDSIESGSDILIQEKSARYMAGLLEFLCADSSSHSQSIQLILQRMMDSLYASYAYVVLHVEVPQEETLDTHRIILLDHLQRRAEQSRSCTRRQSAVSAASNLKRSHSLSSTNDAERDSGSELSNVMQSHEIKIRGISKTLKFIVNHFGEQLPRNLPFLWEIITTNIKLQVDLYRSQRDGAVREETSERLLAAFPEAKLVRDLTFLKLIGENLTGVLQDHLPSSLSMLVSILNSSNPLIRHQVCQCIGVICKLMFDKVALIISDNVIPLLGDTSISGRCGAIEAVALIIEHMDLELIPRINMFIVHVLRRMSDQNDQVRLMATHCFGKLLSLMPLNLERSKQQMGPHASEDKTTIMTSECKFVEQLLNPKKLENYRIPFETKAQLRSYQQEGLNWLAFLNQFNLHGILCDEMGLGKTFMTICMVASDHFLGATPEGAKVQSPSLIVCPPTLIEHWLYEIEKFVPSTTRLTLNPVGYGGNLGVRTKIKNQLALNWTDRGAESHKLINLVVTSYDVLRNDIEFFQTINWNYCVLDEGHIIKNAKTKLSKSVRLLTAKHRLILSGTPIQNNVTELWSLFDFLMPGFLGSERQFNARYAKPILQSREAKCQSEDLEAGALAMESLHRQVLPFILRRLKEDVLEDLPPKIIQDYFCELSPLQTKLYEDFTKSDVCKDVTKRSLSQLSEGEISNEVLTSSKSRVFQALQYLRCVCNHPKLVVSRKHSQYDRIERYLESEKSTIDDINHSSKLRALKQLLIDCGIGKMESEIPQQETELEIESVVNQHRALIFCQLKSMVQIVESDLLKKHLPNITYVRLDGSVPTSQRQSIVSRFNNDPSIDVLLITTQIGGLGLNLTGADTVIFVEHDWNPTRDLQAMDRAHRIGQKKVVNVYRLITKNTLEEKIMGLQKFKTMVSNTVINQDNTGLGTMNVEQLLDLFDSSCGASQATASDAKKQCDGKKLRATELLPELWDQAQYESEYDLDVFVSSLRS